METLPNIIRQNDVARLLGISNTLVRRHAKRGDITPDRDGRNVYYTREQVIRLAELRKK